MCGRWPEMYVIAERKQIDRELFAINRCYESVRSEKRNYEMTLRAISRVMESTDANVKQQYRPMHEKQLIASTNHNED